ncbi:MAG: C4-dicarboxylic acid transporter DauA [SAR324 cluster bacterium]|nr:C4-dicarboxylic acid transporter DauA [SAR324 cluster bacterium]
MGSFLPKNYTFNSFQADLLSGITVGIIALPLAMALAIASGVPPEHGLYTSIFAGIVIALTGGSKFNVSGPTAAFVVVLLPISQKFGLAGLLTATLIAGLILIFLGAAKLGGVIRLIPYPVIIGFTSGIGIVIAGLQIKDFLGIEGINRGGFVSTITQISSSLDRINWLDTSVGVVTLAVLLLFPKLKLKIPSHLVAVLVGTLFAYFLVPMGFGEHVKTIGSEFHYVIDGVSGNGIPPVLPKFALPWNWVDPSGKTLVWSVQLFKELFMAGFAIAMLGAIESLLCAVVADGMTGTKHNSNKELIGQGLGNLVAPFFGGIPATAALARTAANIRAGGNSSVSSIVHGVFLLLSLVFIGKWLAFIPMATLAALLFIVAWNMAEVKHFIRIVKIAPRSDVAVLLACVSLTVLVDMVAAVTVGIVLASVLFIRRMFELTGNQLSQEYQPNETDFEGAEGVVVYEIKGSLFFGAAQKAISTLGEIQNKFHTLILELTRVEMIDMTGIVALESVLADLRKAKIKVIICGPSPQVKERFEAAGIVSNAGTLCIVSSIEHGLDLVESRSLEASSVELEPNT